MTNLDILIKRALEYYYNHHFDLVPIPKNSKAPIELEWTNKSHKNRGEWIDWLKSGLNMGVKTGQKSNITVLDIDAMPKNIKDKWYEGKLQDKEKKEAIKLRDIKLKGILAKLNNPENKTLSQKNLGGIHLFYKYNSKLRKTIIKIDDIPIDIENNGGQVVLFPSTINGIQRSLNFKEIIEIPNSILEILQKYFKKSLETEKDLIKDKIVLDKDFHFNIIKTGNRHNIFMHIGGILRKKFSKEDTRFFLELLNKRCCDEPLNNYEFISCINSLEKYSAFDDKELGEKVLKYLKMVEECTARDIKEALNIPKHDVDRVLSYLIKEGYILKKSRMFKVLQKLEWKEQFMGEAKEIDFKMPYLYDVATFREGDLIVIGAKQKVGKTHIAINIMKRLSNQSKKGYYVCLESGSRFGLIATTLGMKEGDFYYCIHFDPEAIEIEPNAITIIDWLLPKDYATTDKTFFHFVQQLIKKSGNLIIFVQLKDDGSFFAKNMIPMFPALVARYLYKNEEEGTEGYFQIDYIREAKMRRKTYRIPCIYKWETKELLRIDELQKENEEVKCLNNQDIALSNNKQVKRMA